MYTIEFSKIVGTPEEFQNALISNDMKFTSLDVWNLSTTYAIYANGQRAGFIDFYVGKAKNGVHYVNINAIELFTYYSGLGVGRAVLNYFFTHKYEDKYDIVNIYGESHPDTVYWWKDVGATFNMSDKALEERIEEGELSAFCLNKLSFLSKYKG